MADNEDRDRLRGTLELGAVKLIQMDLDDYALALYECDWSKALEWGRQIRTRLQTMIESLEAFEAEAPEDGKPKTVN